MNLPGVKPASEWLGETPGVIECEDHLLCALYERIAAQAFAAGVQQGMEKALDSRPGPRDENNPGAGYNCGWNDAINAFGTRIEAARDAKKGTS